MQVSEQIRMRVADPLVIATVVPQMAGFVLLLTAAATLLTQDRAPLVSGSPA